MSSAVQISENRRAAPTLTTQVEGASIVTDIVTDIATDIATDIVTDIATDIATDIVDPVVPAKAKQARRPKDKPGPHRIIAVGGGKGGSGKSVLVSNLAVAFAQRGFRVIAIDCDLGAANLHTLLGVTNPKTTLTQLFNKDIDDLAEAIIPTPIPGLQLIAGSGAVPGSANIRHSQKQKLLRHISRLPADVVLLDVGAGTSFNTIDIFNLADLRIVVTTPQLTSIQNAYGFVKASAYRLARSLAETKEERSAFDDESRPDETEVLEDFIARIQRRTPAYAKRIRSRMVNFAACIVGNQLQHPKEVNVLHAVTRMIYDFLGLKVPVVSSLTHTPHIHHSVNQRRPLVLTQPFEPNAQQVRQLLEHILRVDVKSLRQHKKGDLNRLLNDIEDMSQREKDAERLAEETPSLSQFARRSERYEVEMKGKVLARDDVYSATVKEVSEHGALIYSELDLSIGEHFEFTFDEERQLIYQAAVRSLRAPGLFGIEFVERTIDPVVVDAWREAFASPRNSEPASSKATQKETHV